MKRNAFVLVLDSLRFDVVENLKALRFIAPNLYTIAKQAMIGRVVTNAQSTQFVLPALFTCTYPLDFGGYNDGIRDRPKSYVEVLKDNGYETFLLATANQLGVSLGYQRGFDVIGTTSDYRTLLEHRIGRTMHYDIERYTRGEIDIDAAIVRVRELLVPLLDGLIEAITKHDRRIWTAGLERLNRRIADGCIEEKKLLATNPKAVIKKLTYIAPGLYWRYLGQTNVDGIWFFLNRVRVGISWRFRSWAGSRFYWPFLTLQHHQAIAGDVFPKIVQFIKTRRDNPWLVHVHLMDLHDCRSVNRIVHVLGLVRFLPRWIAARVFGLSRRRFMYDATLMYIDRQLGSFVRMLQPQLSASETVLVITGDHGSQFADMPRPKPLHGDRMYYEDLEVPIILAGTEREAGRVSGFTDSMGVTRTLLHALDVQPHQSFKSAPFINGGRDAVVSESCGRGYAELKDGILYFAVTGQRYKAFFQLHGDRLRATRLFDKQNDPRELTNIIEKLPNNSVIDDLMSILWRERGELLDFRNVDRSCKPEIVAAV